jgi:hypothetical protein
MLLLQAYFYLVLSIVLGTLLAAPFLSTRVVFFHECTYLVQSVPADDLALTEWGRSRAGVTAFVVERRGRDLWVRSEYRGSAMSPPQAEVIARMRALGYGFVGMEGGSMGLNSGLSQVLTEPQTLAAMLLGMQLSLGLVGLWRIRAAARKGLAMPPLWKGVSRRHWILGALGGMGLLLIGLLNHFVLRMAFRDLPAGPWLAAESMPLAAKTVFLVFGALGAPVAEELFFRGYLLGSFKAVNRYVPGLLLSATLFAAVHFSDPANLVAIWFYGLVLGHLYHRSGSLLAPIIAHAVNNAVAIGWLVLS